MPPPDAYHSLLPLLEEAEQIASGYSGGKSIHFNSAEALGMAIHAGLLKLKFKDTSDVPAMKQWFTPNGDWDTLVGPEGTRIGRQIHDLLPEITITHLPNKPRSWRPDLSDLAEGVLLAIFDAF
jgi:hypothetical protein